MDRDHQVFASDGFEPHKNRRQSKLGKRVSLIVLILFLLLAIAGLIYYVFFRVYDVGKRTISINAEDVEQIDGLAVHGHTWLEKAQVQTLLTHIHADGVKVPSRVKTYQNVDYISADDLMKSLEQFGDKTGLSGHRLLITLKSGQHYSYQDKQDFVHQQAIWVNGQLVGRVLAVDHDEATYIPPADVAPLFNQSGLQSNWSGSAFRLALQKTANPLPVSKPEQDKLISFANGQAIYTPYHLWQKTAYLPTLSVDAALTQLGWSSSFDTWKWTLTDSQTSGQTQNQSPSATKTKPVSLAFVPFYVGALSSFQDVMSNPSAYNQLADDTWTVDASGSLVGSAPAGTASQAATSGYGVYAMVTNLGSSGFDTKVMTTILDDPARTKQLRDSIVHGVAAEDYDGAMLDFETLPASDRDKYSAFVADLAQDLHAEGKKLSVVVPPDTGSENEPWNDGYDQAKLGASADHLVVMAYDYSYIGSKAGPVAPLPWVQQALAYTVSRVPANKVLLGVNAYGYDFAGKHTKAVSLTNVDSFLRSRHITPKWDASAKAPWFQWTDSQGTVHKVYYENQKSLSMKLSVAQTYGVAGVAVWRAGLEDKTFLQTLAAYRKGQIPTASGGLSGSSQ